VLPFWARNAPPTGFTVRTFIAEVEKALREVPNVDNVKVDSDPEFHNEPLSLSGEPPNLREGGGLYPYLEFGRIAFDLLIPSRLQEELSSFPTLST
jgi:hypothetical protein